MINTNINSQTLQDCLQAVDAHDLDRVRKCYAGDAQIVAPGAELQGADQIMGWYQAFVTAFPDIKHEVRKPFVLDYVNVARLDDGGQIKSETYYWDNQSFLTQLGLM